ncbi:hypothetical protein CGS46_06890 [Faecalibacterium langellae]|uniref:Uncharacterized protein n=1 Tax=Faecalibacterium langellae TaxID=3435293 RepID=A0A2A6ZBT1_9FIRM|nr:hypothetical protein CGS46_06890 [Faecalibacterium prausnitzii]
MPLNPLSLAYARQLPRKGSFVSGDGKVSASPAQGQPARKMQKSSPIGGAGKAVRLWLRGFVL